YARATDKVQQQQKKACCGQPSHVLRKGRQIIHPNYSAHEHADKNNEVVHEARQKTEHEINHARGNDLIELHKPVASDAEGKGQSETNGGGEHGPGGGAGAKIVQLADDEVERVPNPNQRSQSSDENPLHLFAFGKIDGRAITVDQAKNA